MTDTTLPALELGHGPVIVEAFLEPTCPFSKRAFQKFEPFVALVGADKVTVRIRLQSQPWHLFSGVVCRAILAASATKGGKAAALKAMAGVYDRREDFEFTDHSHGPNMDRTPADILRDIAAIVGTDLSEPFRLKEVGAAFRWHTRYARQNGIHVSPTFMINGLVEGQMASGQAIEEWAELIKPHLA
jgi:protein-disulfide isomerase